MIDADTLATLVRPAACTVSVYFAMDTAQPDARAPADARRTLLDKAAAELERFGADPQARRAMMGELHAFADSLDLTRHREPGLAMFARWEDGAASLVTAALPLALPEAAIAGRDSYIKPLLPLAVRQRRFNILALSKTDVKLLRATAYGWERVKLTVLPAEAQAELDSRPAADAEALDAARKSLITADPRRIETAVRAALGDASAALVLAGDPHVTGHFIKHAPMRELHPAVLQLNPFAITDAELHARAAALLRPELDAELDLLLQQIDARLGTAEPNVAIRLEEIMAAAGEGRVEAVAVAEDEALWGRLQPGTALAARGRPAAGDEELLNLAAILTLRHGGRAFAAPRQRLPRQVAAAATLRF